ncbi:MAG: monooxygenase [Paracoccaceae bacterium]|nr:MAG: monooxygenase [Paracoccaceae bacterium]
MDCEVLIVGGGPVGLVLGMELARRGVGAVICDMRRRGENETVRCNHVSARSMETFRMLGFADRVRAAGLAPGHPHDVAFRTSFTGREFARIPIPGREGRAAGEAGVDSWWPTPEPPHRINQLYLEPVMLEAAHATPGLTIMHRAKVESFTQDASGVSAVVRDLDGGGERRLRAAFLAGCDGGRSSVRRAIGARLNGDAVIQRVQSSFIRAPGLMARLAARPAWATICFNPRRNGTVYAIDGRELFLVHNYLEPAEPDFESVDRDWAIRMILGVGEDFAWEMIHKEDWFGRRLVADKLREGRVFLAGDAAHIWVPYAGYGMNAGIADAVDLAWLLAARLQGWGGPGMLDAYQAERLPITEQVSRFAMAHAEKMIRNRGAVPAAIEDDGPEGGAARAAFGRINVEVNLQQYACAGLNFGYYYENSPIIAHDGTPPPYTMGDFTPSTVPGARMPHRWLPDGRSLWDALGTGYTLLRVGDAPDAGALVAEARRRGIPLEAVDLPADPDLPEPLLILRPDTHIAWRGTTAPADPAALWDRLTGH